MKVAILIIGFLAINLHVCGQNSYEDYLSKLSMEIYNDKLEDAGNTIRYMKKYYKSELNSEFFRLDALRYSMKYQHKRAIKSMKQALEMSPTAFNYYQMAILYDVNGDLKQAKEYCIIAFSLDSLFYENTNLLIKLAIYLGQYNVAKYYFSKLPQEFWDNTLIAMYARILRVNGDFRNSINVCQRLSDVDSSSYCLCLYDNYSELLLFDSITPLIPYILKIPIMTETSFSESYYKVFYISWIASALSSEKSEKGFDEFKRNVNESFNYGTPEKYILEDPVLRRLGIIYYKNGDWRMAYYFFSFIKTHFKEDYFRIAQISQTLNLETWLTKKAIKELKIN